MRKLVSILLLAFYLLSMEGINLHRHFCGGSIADVSLFNHLDESECCGDRPCNECYDDHVILKVNQEHLVKVSLGQTTHFTSNQILPVPSDSWVVSVVHMASEVSNTFGLQYAPRIRDPLYDKYCSWLI